jgi:hypothetical protein
VIQHSASFLGFGGATKPCGVSECLVCRLGTRCFGASALDHDAAQLKSTYGLYTDTGAGEEVKTYYAGNPQWGATTSAISTDKSP